MIDFFLMQLRQIRQGGRTALNAKVKLALPILVMLPAAIPAAVLLRLMKPWLLVRLGPLVSTRLGHFAANTELYFCEKDANINRPAQRHVDLFYMTKPICNQQLATMWGRVLKIWPAWILGPIYWTNRLIPGGDAHTVRNNIQHDRDVLNLFDRFPPHLAFTEDELDRGEAGLRAMGIPVDARFVCLTVRDDAYLSSHVRGDYSYHSYRDSNVQNYVKAAEELAEKGFFVIRMGARVRAAMNSRHPRVIDYATNGMRSDFMDIYLGAKCAFCVSVGTGFDAVPYIFRRPIAYVNMVPVGYFFTFSNKFIGIFKHHYNLSANRMLSLREIFACDVGFCLHTSCYTSKEIVLIENTPEEICDLVCEMAERLDGTWQVLTGDEDMQQRFWDIFPTNATDINEVSPLHGDIYSRCGSAFLRTNHGWLNE